MVSAKNHYPLQAITRQAGADLSAAPCVFVKMSSGKVVKCGAGQNAIGVTDQEMLGVANEYIPILMGGVLLVKVGSGGVTEGTAVASDANGLAVAVAALSATISATSTATNANAVIPSGATPVTSSGAQPTLTITQPSVATTATATFAGGTLPVTTLGIALETVAEGGYAQIMMA